MSDDDAYDLRSQAGRAAFRAMLDRGAFDDGVPVWAVEELLDLAAKCDEILRTGSLPNVQRIEAERDQARARVAELENDPRIADLEKRVAAVDAISDRIRTVADEACGLAVETADEAITRIEAALFRGRQAHDALRAAREWVHAGRDTTIIRDRRKMLAAIDAALAPNKEPTDG